MAQHLAPSSVRLPISTEDGGARAAVADANRFLRRLRSVDGAARAVLDAQRLLDRGRYAQAS